LFRAIDNDHIYRYLAGRVTSSSGRKNVEPCYARVILRIIGNQGSVVEQSCRGDPRIRSLYSTPA
jgi:hypothetical protein